MDLTLSMFLIVCPFAFLAGMVDAIGGGGGLISIPAYLIAGIPAHESVFTNKLSACLGTIVATIRYCKNNYTDYSLAFIGMIMACIGGVGGANLALWVDEAVFKVILILLLPAIAGYVFFKKDLNTENETKIPYKKQSFIVGLSSLFLGMYAGFYGPGAGTFLILAYSSLAKMNILKAEGNAKLVNMSADICSLLVFLYNGVVLIPLGLTASVFSIAGNYIGAGIAMKKGARVIRSVILSVLAVLFVKIIFDERAQIIALFS